jgi:hypothetical protein
MASWNVKMHAGDCAGQREAFLRITDAKVASATAAAVSAAAAAEGASGLTVLRLVLLTAAAVQVSGDSTSLTDAFSLADDVLRQGVQVRATTTGMWR